MNAAKIPIGHGISWKEELKNTGYKYHYIGSWVAVIFNLVFALNDYFNVNEYWQLFFYVRFAVSSVTLIVLILHKPLKISSEYLIFVPFLLISLQNAFMWSFMDAAHMLKHTLAYIALFIGAGMLILWRIQFSIAVVVLSVIANVVFLTIYSQLSFEAIMINGGILTFTVAVFSILLIQTRYKLTTKEIISRLALEKSNNTLNHQKLIIEEKTTKIQDSIKYAKRIQDAILPPRELLDEVTPNYFIYYEAKDIVSGDFYWFGKQGNCSIVAAVDCTGHGIPGAFMSMIGNTLLNRLVGENKFTRPAQILFELRKGVIKALGQSGKLEQKDGMDIALCSIDPHAMKLEFAGAHNPLYIVRNGELTELKANRMPIGKYLKRENDPFDNHEYDIEKGDMLYMFTDGYVDQFGKVDDKKFSKKRLRELLISMAHLPVEAQEKAIAETMDDWKQDKDQLDDMLLIGIQI
jgi:serine phosphatase RsbU (regulator of sigma subunit)